MSGRGTDCCAAIEGIVTVFFKGLSEVVEEVTVSSKSVAAAISLRTVSLTTTVSPTTKAPRPDRAVMVSATIETPLWDSVSARTKLIRPRPIDPANMPLAASMLSEVTRSCAAICAGVHAGWRERTNPARPAAIGLENDVPCQLPNPPLLKAPQIPDPGA